MNIVMYLLGVALAALGVSVAAKAASSIHEVYSAVLFGSGAICLGLGAVISSLKSISDGISGLAARRGNAGDYAPKSSAASTSKSASEEGRIVTTHKGQDIYAVSNGVRVGAKVFANIPDAMGYIDAMS